jgi:hypothetical protein
MRRLLAACMLMQLVALHHALARPAITGQAVTHVGDLGAHYPLFLIEKSHHPENITVVSTKLDQHCHVILDRAHGFLPTLDFYWLMDATRYKPMAGPLKAGARKRLQFTDAPGHQGAPTAFAVRLDDLSRVQHDLPSPTVQIKTARQGEACMATASLTLGLSNGHATITVESVFTQTEALTLLKKMQAMEEPDALQIDAVTVKGTDVATGQPIARTYHAAHESAHVGDVWPGVALGGAHRPCGPVGAEAQPPLARRSAMDTAGTLTFWGVRGSIPAPGLHTITFGGNTSCVSVDYREHVIIFDAGSGLRQLGLALMARDTPPITGSLFLTHTHWDHIQGLPFFTPAFTPENHFVLYGVPGAFRVCPTFYTAFCHDCEHLSLTC